MRTDKKTFCLLMQAALLLAACQAPAPKPASGTSAGPAQGAPVDLQAEYRALAASGGTVYAVDPAASTVLIYVFRGGIAAKSGHNHVISAPRFEGYVHVPSDQAADARFDLRVPLNELVVDDPALRASTGGNFAGERSAADIEGTQSNMLGPRGIDAGKFPFVQLKSLAVAGDWPVLVAEVAVTLHGVTRQQTVLLHVQRGDTGMKVTGSMVLRQTDFGITPYSLFGGVLSVQDAVVVDFELTGRPGA